MITITVLRRHVCDTCPFERLFIHYSFRDRNTGNCLSTSSLANGLKSLCMEQQ